jgi:hypothetical protein
MAVLAASVRAALVAVGVADAAAVAVVADRVALDPAANSRN